MSLLDESFGLQYYGDDPDRWTDFIGNIETLNEPADDSTTYKVSQRHAYWPMLALRRVGRWRPEAGLNAATGARAFGGGRTDPDRGLGSCRCSLLPDTDRGGTMSPRRSTAPQPGTRTGAASTAMDTSP